MLYDFGRELTIPDKPKSTPNEAEPEALALAALAWVLSGEERAQRLLALTGLTPDALRHGLGDRAVLGAVLEFLCAHEPDLLAAAEALETEPQALADAARSLTQ